MLYTNHFLETVAHFFYIFAIYKYSGNLEFCPFILSNYYRSMSIFYFPCGDYFDYKLKPACYTNNPLARFSPGTMANEIMYLALKGGYLLLWPIIKNVLK